jgi:hypothetical protein
MPPLVLIRASWCQKKSAFGLQARYLQNAVGALTKKFVDHRVCRRRSKSDAFGNARQTIENGAQLSITGMSGTGACHAETHHGVCFDAP